MGAYQRLRDPIVQAWIELYSSYKDYMQLSPLKSQVPHSSGLDLAPVRTVKGNEKHIPFVMNQSNETINYKKLHLSSSAIESVYAERKEAIQKLPIPIQTETKKVTQSKAKKNVPVSPLRKTDKLKSKSTFM
jgi:hypothetical protein